MKPAAADLWCVVDAAVDDYSSQLPWATRQRVRAELRHAHEELIQGRGNVAVEEVRVIVETTCMPAAQLLLAAALLEINQPLSALAALFNLEQSQSACAESQFIQGVIFYSLDRRSEARSVLQRAVQRKPDLMAGWKLLMKMALEEENRNAAFLVFQEALRYSMRYPRLLSLQSCLRQMPVFEDVSALWRGLEKQPAADDSLPAHRYASLVSLPSSPSAEPCPALDRKG